MTFKPREYVYVKENDNGPNFTSPKDVALHTTVPGHRTTITGISYSDPKHKCECGAAKVNSKIHSTWCPEAGK